MLSGTTILQQNSNFYRRTVKSISYYNKYHERFINDTVNLDMSNLYQNFESHLNTKAHILDLGCGCGRDSKYFMEQGYQVTAMDGSEKLVNYCNEILKVPAVQRTYEAFKTDLKFDGIWACASLLHVDRDVLPMMIQKYVNMMKNEGVFYMSFKEYKEDFEFEGRYFTCFTKKSMESLLSTIGNISIVSIIETPGIQNIKLRWIGAIIKKVGS